MSVTTVSPPAATEGSRQAPGSLGWIVEQTLRDREALLEYIFEASSLGRLTGMLMAANGAMLAIYGAIVGSGSGWAQALSSAVKLPLLYLLSLLICFPALYIINVLMGSRMGLLQTFATILTAVMLNSLILISFAPIVAFFLFTGSEYDFVKVMHVGVMGFAGLWAMGALYRTLGAICERSNVYPRHAIRIMMVWMLLFGFVGTQMAWTLRPFLGAPDLKFEILRKEGAGNFYQAVLQSLAELD